MVARRHALRLLVLWCVLIQTLAASLAVTAPHAALAAVAHPATGLAPDPAVRSQTHPPRQIPHSLAAAPQSAPSLALSRPSGRYKDTLTITGTAFGASEPISIYLDTTTTAPLSGTTTSTAGNFTDTLIVPQAISGTHTLLAIGQRSGLTATVPFLILPGAYLLHYQGNKGTSDVLRGAGFAAHETVVGYWSSTTGPPLPITATTNAIGTFGGSATYPGITFTVPLSPTGIYFVYGVGQSSHGVAHATFTLKPHLSLTPTSGPAGATIKVAGTGYGAHEAVPLKYNCGTSNCSSTTVLTTTQTDGNGAFSVLVPLPTTTSLGAHAIGGKGSTSGVFATATYSVTAPAATATPTPTRLPTATPTGLAPTATPTKTPTATPTITPTATATITPTVTPTPRPTATPTANPTATPTRTATPTLTPAATPTRTATPISTSTQTAVPTPTATRTPTATATATATPTVIPTAGSTPPPSPTSTATPTATLTPTSVPTATPTLLPTATLTPAATRTPSVTPTISPTSSPTLTATPTASATATATRTPTSTWTPTRTATPTQTPIPTATPVCPSPLPNTITSSTELKANPCGAYLSNGTTVQSGITLTVDADVTVEFAYGSLNVQGTLAAAGSTNLPITLTTANSGNYWGGISVGTGGSATIRYATLSYAGVCCPNGALSVQSGTASLDHVIVSNNSGTGVYADASSALTVTNSTISGNGGEGVAALGSPSVLQHDTFTNNGSNAVELGIPNILATMANNAFSGNSLNGVYLDSGILCTPATLSAGDQGTVELGNVLTVASGTTLTVASGDTVLGNYYNGGLSVLGALRAIGIATQPITFTSANSGNDWGGISVGPGGSATLSYASVSYGGQYSSGALYVQGAQASLDHVTVSNSPDDGVYADSTSALTVTNSSIATNGSEGIVALGSPAIIQHSTFTNNGNNALEIGVPNTLATTSQNTFSGNGFNGTYVDLGTLSVPATLSAGDQGTVELINTLTVASGTNLTVAPGETMVGSYNSLFVQGTLSAVGTATQPITFTAADTSNPPYSNWSGISVSTGGRVAMSYATLSYGGYSGNGMLSLTGASASLDHVTISNSRYMGVYADSTSALTVTNSTIISNGSEGIVALGSPTVIQDDTFTTNTYDALELGVPNTLATMSQNSFSGNGLNGVYLDGGTLSAPATLSTGDQGTVELGNMLTVASGTTLTVAPGEFVFGDYYDGGLSVLGTLNAIGTAAQPITFTTANAGSNWDGINVSTGGTANLSYTTLSYGSTGCCGSASLAIQGAIANLSHVTITNSSGNGLYVNNSVVTVQNSIFSYDRTGIVASLGTDPSLAFTPAVTLTNNTVTGNAGTGISASVNNGNQHLTTPAIVITGNTSSNNGGDGLDYSGTSLIGTAAQQVTPTITGNTFNNNGGWAATVAADFLPPTLNTNSGSGNGHNAIALSGQIATNWVWPAGGLGYGITTGSGGPYLGSWQGVQIAAGAALTIQPGQTILGSNGGVLQVNGSLSAAGTATQPITFTSANAAPQSGDWGGITLNNGTLTLSYTSITYAGDPLNTYGGTATVSNCTINNDDRGVYVSNTAGSVTSCTVSNNGGDGIYVNISNSNGRATTPSFAVTGNTVTNNAGDGLDYYADSTTGRFASPATEQVTNNTFNNNGGVAANIAADFLLPSINTNNGSGNNEDIFILAGTVNQNWTWPNQHLIYSLGGADLSQFGFVGGIRIDSGATLTLQPGIFVKTQNATYCCYYTSTLEIQGGLVAQGTAAAPIYLTSLKDDSVGGDTNNDGAATTPAPGDWGGITIDGGANVSMANVTVTYSGGIYGSYGGSSAPASFSLSSCTVTNNTGGIGLNSATGSINNCHVTNNGGTGVSINTASPFTVNNNTISSNGGDGLDFTGLGGTSNPPVTANVANNVLNNNTNLAASIIADVLPPSLDSNSGTGNFLNSIAIQGTITQNWTWSLRSLPYVIVNNYYCCSPTPPPGIKVAAGALLTLPAGLVLKFGSFPDYCCYGAGLDVAGSLAVQGTNGSPVYLTSIKDDSVGGDTNGDGPATQPAPGDWPGITVESGGSASISNASITYASTALSANGSTVSIHNSTIANDNFGVANCAGCTYVHAENNYWGTPTGPAPFGSGPGVSYHQQCTYYPIINQTLCFNVLDVGVELWQGETTYLLRYNGPSGNGSSAGSGGGQGIWGFSINGSSTEAGGYHAGSANIDTISFGEPVDTATGSYDYSHTDLTVAGRTPLIFTRSYNSRTAAVSPGPLGYGWTFSYGISLTVQNSGSTILVTFGTGRTDVFSQNNDGSYSAAPGQFDTLSVNGDGSYDVTDKQLNDYHFNAAGTLQTITDRNGNVTSLTYNGIGQLASVSVAGGRSLSFSYNGTGQVASVSDNANRTISFGYSVSGDLTSVTDARGNTTTYGYDGNHQMLTGVDRNGNTFVTNTYDSAGHVVSQINALGGVTTFTYYPATPATVVTDPRGGVTTYTYNQQLELISVKNSLNEVTTYTYDSVGDRLTATDPNNHTWTYTYDNRGNMTTSTTPLGRTTSYAYDAGNQPTIVVDPLNQTTLNGYDAHENLLNTTDPLGYVTRYTYDSQGDRLSMTDPDMHTIQYGYDTAGDRTSVTDPLGHTTTTAFDAVGRPIVVTDPLGHATTTSYDANDDVISSTDALSDTTSYSYDGEGNRLSMTDARHNTTLYVYDTNNDLQQVTDAASGVTLYGYDLEGNRIAVTDALSHTTTTVYDPLNRVSSVISPLTETVSYQYDAAGNLQYVTNARGNTVTYGYDADNHQIAISYADAPGVSYGYNADGLRTTMNDGSGTTLYAYDADNRMTAITQTAGTITYTYDGAGNRTGITLPGNRTSNYTYDAANLLSTVTDWHGNVITDTYDIANRLSTVSYPNGLSAAYNYDNANRLRSLTYSQSSTTLGSFAYTYDANGNRLTETDGSTVTTYVYDSLNRLTTVQAPSGTTSYGYDAAGNRLSMTTPQGSTSYGYNAANELLSTGAMTYTYDADGNRVSATNGVTATTYSYDDLNYLTAIATTNGLSASYGYNGDHARVSSTVNGATTTYLLDLTAPLPTVVQQAGAGVTTSYLYGSGLLAQDNGTSEQFLLPDGLGSTRLVANASGSVVGTMSYDAYGTQTANGSSSVFGFTGQQADAESGLLYLRARYYDPATGEFLQRDPYPIDPYNPVTLNRYAYAGDNPVNMTDPSGRDFGFDDLGAIVTGAAGGVIGQAISDIANGNRFDYRNYIAAAAGGAVGGEAELLITENTGGLGAVIAPEAGGAIGGVVQQEISDLLHNGHLSSLNDVTREALIGAISGGLSAPFGDVGGSIVGGVASTELEWLWDSTNQHGSGSLANLK